MQRVRGEKGRDGSFLLSFPNTALNAVHMSRKLTWQRASIGNLSACWTVLSGARVRKACQDDTARTASDGGSASVLTGSDVSLNN